MRISQYMMSTLREVPAEAEVVSHQLLLRAGMIRKVGAGVYNYLPLGFKVLQKISAIVREEMNKAGGQEILMPIIQPAELWLESGRWNVYGDELFRLKDRHNRDFCLGPTHEEIITSLVRKEISSYKQLPLLLYQIQSKFRDERRPRFGLMRSREFMMKDLYSFDQDDEGLNISYKKMFDAYTNIFKRCGLTFRAVEADSGAIGGSSTHEFMVLASSGEDEIVFCSACDYAANVERAESLVEKKSLEESIEERQLIHTPNMHTIEQITDFLNIPKEKTIKTLFYESDKGIVCAVVRGDREINEIKLLNQVGAYEIQLANDEVVRKITGSNPGYVGPIDISGIEIIVDEEVLEMRNAVAGANKEDYHFINVNYGHDFKATKVSDIRTVKVGDRCPRCSNSLDSARGIEVGHIFKLGTKYSANLDATFLDKNGKEKPFVMGCYGVGIGRTMAASVEQNYDNNGIIWPVTIAPFEVIVVPASMKDEKQAEIAEQLYQELLKAGIDVIIDDRNERAGVKFADADLIGYPYRITIGKKTVKENSVDLKTRATGEEVTLSITEACDFVSKLVNEKR
jgi:prolyl-tRNA synthetase